MNTSTCPHAPLLAPSPLGIPLVTVLRARTDARLAALPVGSDPASRAMGDLLEAGGKRLRPVLVYVGGRVAGLREERVDGLAEAAELVHVASLLHDDLLDGADTRRGRPTAWRRFGPKAAVLGGDRAHVMALARVARAPDPLLARFLETVASMIDAQSLETEQTGSLEGGIDAWRAVAWGKTAALCGWCAAAGALAAGDAALASSLRAFGEGVGLAFQAVDDLLDLVPGIDPGKPAFSDLRARVPSLPIRLAATDPALAEAILGCWRRGAEPPPTLTAAVHAAGAAGTVSYAAACLGAARSALHALPSGEALTVLSSMLDELSHRAAACGTPSPEPS